MNADEHLLPPLRGRFAFDADEGFRVVFRRADRGSANALAWGATLLVVGATLASLLADEGAGAIAWMIAGLVDFAAIYVIFALRAGLSKGGVSVDGAERRVFLPEGAELAFERLRCVSVRQAGAGRAELVLVHDAGALAFGPRPADEVEQAAPAVARVAEIPLVPWEAAGAAIAGSA